MAANSPTDKSAILSALKEQYGKVVYTYTTHIKEARIRAHWNSAFLWADIILSAITTGGIIGLIITNSRMCEIASCVASVILLVISLYTKEAKLAERSVSHKEFASKIWLIRERYLALMTDASALEYEEIAKRRDCLQEELATLYQHEPLTSNKSYKQAQQALKRDEEQFFSTEELNKLLPEHLRTK